MISKNKSKIKKAVKYSEKQKRVSAKQKSFDLLLSLGALISGCSAFNKILEEREDYELMNAFNELVGVQVDNILDQVKNIVD